MKKTKFDIITRTSTTGETVKTVFGYTTSITSTDGHDIPVGFYKNEEVEYRWTAVELSTGIQFTAGCCLHQCIDNAISNIDVCNLIIYDDSGLVADCKQLIREAGNNEALISKIDA